jgi:hypothetical protein
MPSDGPLPINQPVHPPTLGPFKVTYRPLLADIVQPGDVKELCKLLVVVSGNAAKAYAGIAGLTFWDFINLLEKVFMGILCCT